MQLRVRVSQTCESVSITVLAATDVDIGARDGSGAILTVSLPQSYP